MKYDFNTLINRNELGSDKWELMKQTNPNVPKNIAPLSVADADIKLAPEIQQGLIKFIQNDPVFGYTCATDKYYNAVINWMKTKHNYAIEKDWIVLSNGVVTALNNAVAAFTNAGEGVIIFTPVYPPFYRVTKANDRKVVPCPLINQDTKYSIDFDKFETLAKQPENTLLILCSPHNPIGRVWQKDELEKIAKICLDNNITIISDEIHGDLIMPGYTHYPLASLSPEIANITITCTAPSKSFNLAGLQASNIIIKNPELREKFVNMQTQHGFSGLNTLAFEATTLAYTKAKAWLEEFKQLIYQNYQTLTTFIEQNLPNAKVYPLEGTYLAWIDFNSYVKDYHELEAKMLKANLYLDEGYIFGTEGEGYERINLACPTHVLIDALNRMKEIF